MPRVVTKENPKVEEDDTFHGAATTTGIAKKINSSEELQKSLEIIIQYTKNGWAGLPREKGFSHTALTFFEVNNLIEHMPDDTYKMTDFGRDVLALVVKNKY